MCSEIVISIIKSLINLDSINYYYWTKFQTWNDKLQYWEVESLQVELSLAVVT
jgi:hypothetical protein